MKSEEKTNSLNKIYQRLNAITYTLSFALAKAISPHKENNNIAVANKS